RVRFHSAAPRRGPCAGLRPVAWAPSIRQERVRLRQPRRWGFSQGLLESLLERGLRGFEHLPAAAQRLVELDAVDEQLGIAVVRGEAHGEPRALRVEEREQ